jgi:hypothetical protein
MKKLDRAQVNGVQVICQDCRFHSNKPSICDKKKKYVKRKGSCIDWTSKK